MPPNPTVQIERTDHAASYGHGKRRPAQPRRQFPHSLERKEAEEDKRQRTNSNPGRLQHLDGPDAPTKIEQLRFKRRGNLQRVLRMNTTHVRAPLVVTERSSRRLTLPEVLHHKLRERSNIISDRRPSWRPKRPPIVS